MCMDTTIIHYPDSKNGGNDSNDREDKAQEAKRIYLERQAQKKQHENTINIKLK